MKTEQEIIDMVRFLTSSGCRGDEVHLYYPLENSGWYEWNEWSNIREPDHKYPICQLRIVARSGFFDRSVEYGIVDETGWDGFEEVPPKHIATFASLADARGFVSLKTAFFSDPIRVADYAIRLRYKRGTFSELKQAIDCRDK